MTHTTRLALSAIAFLAILFALHVQLNLGGWRRMAARWAGEREVRGELVVGFLPVT